MEAASRRVVFMHALMFVGSFSLVFIILGISLGLVGSILQENLVWLQRVAGIALIILGLHLTELVTIPFLLRTYQIRQNNSVGLSRNHYPQGRLRQYRRSILVGVAFSLGWTPCVGPVLAGILTLAADSGSVAHGTLLLTFYATGLGVPFLLAGTMVGLSSTILQRVGPYLRGASIGSGLLLIFLGMLIFLDRVMVLNELFAFLGSIDAVSHDGKITGVFGFTVAFFAGILSFFSPCVFPLVPIYLSHMAGIGMEMSASIDSNGKQGI